MKPKIRGIVNAMGTVASKIVGAIGDKGVHALDLADALSANLQDMLEEQKKTNDTLDRIYDNQEEFLEILENCAENDCKTIEDIMHVWKEITKERKKEDKVIEVEATRIDR